MYNVNSFSTTIAWIIYTFCVNISLRLYVFCLLVVLVNLSELAKWLARQNPLGKPICGREIISKAQAEERLWFFFQFSVPFHCFTVRLSCLPALHNKFNTPMAQYSLFVLRVPLNTNQLTTMHNLAVSYCMGVGKGGPKNLGDAAAPSLEMAHGWPPPRKMPLPTHVTIPNLVALGQTI